MNSRYPQNWNSRSLQCRTAANWVCQHCQKSCRRPREALEDFIVRTSYPKNLVEAHPRRWNMQAAHINHDIENPDAELVALCLPCHRRYDNPQMARIKKLEQERQGQLSTDHIAPFPYSGFQLPLDPDDEPYGLVNEATSRKTANPVVLKGWIEDRISLLSTVQDRLAFLRQLQPDSGEGHSARLNAVRVSLPYRCKTEDLQTACKLALVEFLARESKAENKEQRRQHRLKGHASGYIEEREGNKHRQSTALSYYYRWDSPEGRVTEYIPVAKVRLVQSLIAQRVTALEILRALCDGKKKITRLSARLLESDSDLNQLPLFRDL